MEELNSLYENLLAELECPVCSNYMTPPIRQCETGHGICEHCMMKLQQCPLCRKKFTNAKNISLETLAHKMHYPCLNQSLGCDAKVMLEQRENHIKHCSFKGFECAMNNCTWTGKVEDLSKHWSSKQLKRRVYQSSNVCQMKITKSGSYYINLVEAHNNLFWFKCRSDQKKIYWAVQLIGPNDKASSYFYEIELFKPRISKPTITFSNYCQSVDIVNSDLFKQSICAATNIDCLSHLLNVDQHLFYYMHIYERVEVSDIDCAQIASIKEKTCQKEQRNFEILKPPTESYSPPNSWSVFTNTDWSLLFKTKVNNFRKQMQ